MNGSLAPSSSTTNTSALQIGGGVDVKIINRISFRGEFRDFYTGVPELSVSQINSRAHNVVYSGGVVLHF